MSDTFANVAPSVTGPLTHGSDVAANDGVDLANVPRALNVATGGAVRVTLLGGNNVTLQIAAGIPFPVRVSRVWATGTTATGIIALW